MILARIAAGGADAGLAGPASRSLALAALLVIGLVAGAAAQVPAADGLRPVEDPLFEVRSVVPASWAELSGGVYARGVPPSDLALIVIQSAPVTEEQLWQAMLPQLTLTEVPAVTDESSSGALDWTLHAFDLTIGAVATSVEVAVAEQDGRTYLVMLQSAPGEMAVLRDAVLLPALDATRPLTPEPTADPSTFDYKIEEVAFPGGSPGVELAGTLTLPSGPGPHPAIVLLTGSGPQDRDESLKPITTLKPFAILADALTSAGIGVLRFDDRGVGGSSGDYCAATVEELASDGAAAIDYLEARDDIDPERIGMLGHSEGGIYAAMLGADDPRVAFVVGLAPSVVEGVAALVSQNEALVRSTGGTAEEVAQVRAFAEVALTAVRDGEVDVAEEASREYFGGVWDRLDEADRALVGNREAYVERQVGASLPAYSSDWFRTLLATDPAADWAKVGEPVLGVFGAKDVQVVSDLHEPALRAALESGGNQDHATIVFPDANHLFQAARSGAVEEYGSLAPEFAPGVVDAIVDWVVERAGLPD